MHNKLNCVHKVKRTASVGGPLWRRYFCFLWGVVKLYSVVGVTMRVYQYVPNKCAQTCTKIDFYFVHIY